MTAARGYAYLYLLFLLVLLSIATTAAATVQYYETRRQEEQELLRIGREFRAALISYRSSRPERVFPRSIDELLADTRSAPMRHLRRRYFDPITRSQEWGLLTQAGQIVGVHSLSDRKPLKQAGFEPEESAFEGSAHYSDWAFAAVEPELDGSGSDSDR